MDFYLVIDGTDITDCIAYNGVQWQRTDVDGEGAGRDLTGDLRRNRVATKRRLDITCVPLTAEKASMILSLIMPEWVTVEYYDPQVGGAVTKTMYSNNNPATFLIRKGGVELWNGITFPLIER